MRKLVGELMQFNSFFTEKKLQPVGGKKKLGK
jgi:hypothetical protein